MPKRRYYLENRERLLAQTRAWKAANPDRARAHNRESMRRAAVRRKATERRRARGRVWYAEHREQERERARAFRREHPEKVREYKQRFRSRHPGRAAEQSRRGTERWRDRNADAVREKQRAAAAGRREDNPDLNRDYYYGNIEKERQRGREASRRRSRLKQLGLPPRRVQRVYANDRRANDRGADAFFARRRGPGELQQLHREGERPFRRPTAAQLASIRARRRIMSPGELRTAGEHLQARLRAAKARDLARAFLPEAVAHVLDRHSTRLRQQIEMDSIARQLRGAEPYDVDAELQRRAGQEAGERVAAVAARSVDEDQMRRLMNASFPAGAARRGRGATPSVAPPSRTGRGTSAADIER